MKGRWCSQLPVVSSVLTLLAAGLCITAIQPSTAEADPIDDAEAQLSRGRPCRAADILEDAIDQGYSAPGLLRRAREECQEERRRRERRDRREAIEAAVRARLDEARALSDAGDGCGAVALLEAETDAEVATELAEALTAAEQQCVDERQAEAARLEAEAAARAELRRSMTYELTAAGWVLVEAGTYRWGSDASDPWRQDDEPVWGPESEVRLHTAFFVQPHEATQGDWEALMGNNPSAFRDCGSECPVENVTWYDAAAFANAMSRQAGAPECYVLDACRGEPGRGLRCSTVTFAGTDCTGYRLPTEVEWEIVARAGATDPWVCGDDPSCLTSVAWTADNADGVTHAVGQLEANDWGIDDVLGNVAEWTHSEYVRTAAGGEGDPTGAVCALRCAVRGGSLESTPRYARLSYRTAVQPDRRAGYLGFRLVRSLPVE